MTVIDQIFYKVAEIAIPHFFITVEAYFHFLPYGQSRRRTLCTEKQGTNDK